MGYAPNHSLSYTNNTFLTVEMTLDIFRSEQ